MGADTGRNVLDGGADMTRIPGKVEIGRSLLFMKLSYPNIG